MTAIQRVNPPLLFSPASRSIPAGLSVQYPLSMGRTLPSAAIAFHHMKADLKTFQRALAPSDQRSLDELFIMAGKHVSAAQYAASPLPEQIYLLAMLLEMHKELIGIKQIAEILRRKP